MHTSFETAAVNSLGFKMVLSLPVIEFKNKKKCCKKYKKGKRCKNCPKKS